MYSVILRPRNCPKREGGWIGKHNDGDRMELSDSHYNYHKAHGCMEVVEHYIMEIVSDTQCPTCGKRLIKREKKVLALGALFG